MHGTFFSVTHGQRKTLFSETQREFSPKMAPNEYQIGKLCPMAIGVYNDTFKKDRLIWPSVEAFSSKPAAIS